MSYAQTHTQNQPQALVVTAKLMLAGLEAKTLEPVNDSARREYREPDVGRKLLTIAVMISMICCLVWSMG